MSDQEIARLRAELTRTTGAARAQPLLRLGQLLAQRYWRTGPGTTEGMPDQDAAIDALREARALLDRADFLRVHATQQLGMLIGGKITAYGGPPELREEGIGLLTEVLTAAGLNPAVRDVSRLVLGQLYLVRVTRGLQAPDAVLTAARTRSALPGGDDLDRAVACFRQVVDGPAATDELDRMARVLLSGVDAMRGMTRTLGEPGGLGTADFDRLTEAVQDLKRMQEDARGPRSFLDTDRIVDGDAIDYPIAVVVSPEPPAAPPPPRPMAPPPPIDLDRLRRDLRGRLVRGAGIATALAARLVPGAPSPPAARLDDLVAAAVSIVHRGGDTPLDRLTAAVLLYQRSRADDGGGWAGDDDLRTAGEMLRATAAGLPSAPPAVVSVALTLDGMLGAGHLAAAFAPVTAVLRRSGAAALAYHRPGGLHLLDAATGRFRAIVPGDVPAGRIVVVGDRPIPGHDGSVSFVPSARSLTDSVNP